MAKEIKLLDVESVTENNEFKEKKVKITNKMLKKVFSFLNKIAEGVKTVPYIPGAIFALAKLHKETAKKEKTKGKEDETEKRNQEVKEKTFSERVEEKVNKYVAEDTIKKGQVKKTDKNNAEEVKEQKETKDKEDKTIVKGKSLTEVLKKAAENRANLEETKNEPAKAEEVELPVKVEEKPKKEKKNLEDLTEFATYKDYKYAYFWNYKINKYDADVLDSVAKDLAKVADVNQFRTLLTEAQFNDKKAKQVKAKEISEIKKKHKEEMTQAEQKRQADVQAAIDERQKEVDSLNEKLETARSKNRTLNSKLKVTTESLAQIQEKADLVGIKAISDIINTANEKISGIDERAKERAKAKEESAVKTEIDTQVDKIMNDINKNVYGSNSTEENSETKEESAVKTEPDIQVDKMMNDINKNVYGSNSTEENSETKEEPQTSSAKETSNSKDSLMQELDHFDDSNSVSIFASTDPNYPGTITIDNKGNAEAKWEPSPRVNSNKNDSNMEFDPETRAKIGQEAFQRMLENNLTFDEAKEQVAAEYAAKANQENSKGRTR